MKEFTIEQLLKEKTTFTPSSHETDPDKKGEVDTDLLLSFQNKKGYSNVTESPDKNQKYTTSNLNEDQKGTLLEAINSIMENTQEYCESDFSLEKLAMLVNSNKSYISQIINETYHVNFNGFVNEYRIREARIRLTDIEQYGNYTIQTISESVGYKSSTTFINVFKKITGITPSMYQKMVKAQKDL
ncbi:helix-turn-helix transcriptional regulator [Oscillospiraceae bacterium N12]|uniref:Helix-turn-helix transcriptional regulator n=1 Tax=Jilunia laotingensis TaxID=2763675 RepID=A0A926F8F9_9BACT|nr:AraC family transcriptional regulator [Jilunia laotingensis]MBC8594007.1 helix-turn-helix transcriptional regulator [Jilunia laotingensis]